MAVNDVLYDKGGAVYNVKASGYGVAGNGSTDDSGALNTLLNTTMQSAGGVAYFPPGTYFLDAALTTPRNVTLAFASGARLKPNSGDTLTVNGPIDAPVAQIFDTSAGGSVLLGRGATDRIYPQWFGARGDALRRVGPGSSQGASITTGTTALTAAATAFTSADVGKLITVRGAGAGGADLYTTIQGYTSATAVTLANAAGTTVSDATFVFGSDDAPAIKAAVATAFGHGETGHHPSIFFPAGGYLVNATDVLGANTPVTRYGLLFQGEGLLGSELILRTGGTARWFYDQADHLAYTTFENLGFSADSPAYGNGFRIHSSNGHAQMFQFRSCALRDLDQGFDFGGTVMASEMRYFGCKFYGIKRFYTIDNSQSLEHEFFGCDVEQSTGDLFKVTGGGGGSVRMFGGSVIWGEGSTSDARLLFIDSTSVGTGNYDFTFTGIRTEMRSAYAKLVKYAGDSGGLLATFQSCNFTGDVTGGSRVAVEIGAHKTVRFVGCSLPDDWSYTVGSSGTGAVNGGVLGFEGCRVPTDLSGRITLSSTYGRAYARDCQLREALAGYPASASDPLVREAPNFDYNWLNDARGDVGALLKTAVLKPNAAAWPDSGDQYRLLLPENAVVRFIHVLKPAGSGSDTYRLKVANADSPAVLLGDSGAGTTASTLSIDEDLFTGQRGGYYTGTDLDQRTLVLYADPAPASMSQTGGFAIIEYY